MEEQFGDWVVSQIVSESSLFQRDVSAWVDTIDKDRGSLTAGELVDLINVAEGCVKQLRLVADLLRSDLASRMESRGEKETQVVLADGSELGVERETRITRTKVQTVDLIKAVEEKLADPYRRLDQETGEVTPEHEAILVGLKEAFRFEPRWATIKELGLNDDEFCEKSYKSTVSFGRGKK
jgi:hypothetical protein